MFPRALAALLALVACAHAATALELARDGKPLVSIVVAPSASPRVEAAAKALAQQLGRIAGQSFQMTHETLPGVRVGRASDFGITAPWDEKDPTRQEDYLLRFDASGGLVIGASDLAVEHAVWDLLYRVGYRQFFPGDHWEVVPHQPTISLSLDTHEHPAYYSRRIWYGSGLWDYNAQTYADWCARNRAGSGIDLHTGHSYDGFIRRNKAAFQAHPEYLGLLNGQRTSSKLCISNPGLRQLVIDDCLQQFRDDPTLQSVSTDPSDGGGWCECDACAKLGSITDRAVTLANAVAEAVDKAYPGQKYVGMYAYAFHSPPPSIRVHPRVVISIATAFIQGDYTVDKLIDGWSQKCQTLGIREYYSVHTWDRDLPGKSRGSNLVYLRQTIPHFADRSARFLSAESSDNWGCNGLGYYIAARLMWDPREASSLDALVDDFVTRSFGPAKEPMRKFYALIDGSNKPLISDDLVGRMYRLLDEAMKQTTDPAIRARLTDLVLYTRYVDLFTAYSAATGKNRQPAFEAVIRHSYRMRTTSMTHVKGAYRDIAHRDKTVTIPADAAWNVPEGKNPWKSSEPFSREEIAAIVSTGIQSHKLLEFTPVSFSDQLVPAAPLKLAKVATGNAGIYSRNVRNYYTWADSHGASLHLKVKAGIIYDRLGPAKIDVYPAAEPEAKSVCHVEVAPDKQVHEVTLTGLMRGLNRIELSDRTAGTLIDWPDSTPMTTVASTDQPTSLYGRWSMYFYVPRGTKTIGGYASGEGNLVDPAGQIVHTFDKAEVYFNIPVPPGQDGKLWKFTHSSGQRLLMTVPPCLARNADELLLPQEVIARDQPK